MNRKVGLVGVLVVLIAISVYMWTTKSTTVEVDNRIAQMKESFTCQHCGKQFELTVAQATKELRSKHDIFCPYCKQGGAEKNDILVDLGSGEGFGPDDGDKEPEEEEEKPRMGGGMMGPVD